MGLRFLDTTFTKILDNKYILLAYLGKNKWIATSYLEISKGGDNFKNSKFLKSSTVEISENSQLKLLRENWDSLQNDWYLPFVTELELNGKKGYFPSYASDMGYVHFYAIDKIHTVFKKVYEDDLNKERNDLISYTKNANFEYNYSQPTFIVIKYLMTLFESKTFFSDFKSE